MTTAEDDVVLLTIRVRRDVAVPDGYFISMRQYVIGHGPEPERAAEVGTIERAVELTGAWLEDLAKDP